MNRTSVFAQLADDNNLDSAALDNVVNIAFDELKNNYKQFEMSYDEDGVRITNFQSCDEEETGGFTQDQVENNLTDELLQIANNKA